MSRPTKWGTPHVHRGYTRGIKERRKHTPSRNSKTMTFYPIKTRYSNRIQIVDNII